MTTRVRIVLLLSLVLAACHRPTEVRGLYVSQDGVGTFFPCDDAKATVAVQDSTLDARYRAAASGSVPMFVRLRGVKGHSGSIYGGQRLFQVQQVLEVRPRASGECPGIAQPIAPLLPPS